MKKIVLATLIAAALAGCSQTTGSIDKADACQQTADGKCTTSKYGVHATSLPPLFSPGV
ncbi:lipoprotein [Ciceribacter ferrooxidans]|uniref:lipoprotein n=1 Tax=Ciceribacter ferrooxidans TaxID=2509717 RepID=UPI0013ED0AAE|nr:lipoprotein [Ciceribacter ferrooxidans]